MDPNRPPDPLEIEQEREVSPDERDQILGQIDRAIENQREPLDAELANLRPRKRGGVFPILVNAVAAVLVVAGVFVLSQYFTLRNESIALSSAGFVSAEGGLVAALRRESEAQIREKEAQIAAIEQRLQAMDRQTLELKGQLQSDLQTREEELRRRIEAELGAERDRLRAAGTSDVAIDRQLRQLESQRESALRAELEQYRSVLDTALQRKEQELADSRQQLQSVLSTASGERVRLAAQLTQREAELRAQFARERESLQQEASAAERRLADLQEARRQEQLLEDQMEGIYREVLDRLGRGDSAGAAESLARLNALLDSPALLRAPGLLERRALDRALAGALGDLLALKAPGSQVARRQGDAPADPAAQTRLIEDLRLEVRTLENTIAGLQTAARQRPTADTASARDRIAELELRVARLNADLSVVTGEKARLERWKAGLDALSSRYAGLRPRVRRLIAEGGETNLREAERLLLETLNDPAAATILPGMAEHFEQVDRGGIASRQSAGEQQGREAALTEILRYLNYLSRGTGSPELESQVMAQARTDPLYRAVIREIQILRAGGTASGALSSPYLLLGTVASASGTKCVIDPLGDVPAAVGAGVQIRRSDDLEQETLIARGTIEQIRGGKVYARVDAILTVGVSPQSRDLVYVEPR